MAPRGAVWAVGLALLALASTATALPEEFALQLAKGRTLMSSGGPASSPTPSPSPIPPGCEPYNEFPGYLCPSGNNCSFTPFSLVYAGTISKDQNFTACFTVKIARCAPNDTCCNSVFNNVDKLMINTKLECSDGFEDITIDGTVVPSRFDYFASGVSSLTAYDLAGLGLIREGAQVCVHISSCCRNFAEAFDTNRA
ncbi:hypothetical protein CHLRE_03g1611501v5, partial [Chlamydomonas reinhardtii]